MPRLIVLLAAVALVAGCATTPTATAPPATSTVHHVVLMTLHDAGDTAALRADCDRLLSTIPSVTGYWVGPSLDTGRSNVLQDFHLGLYIGFADEAGYAEYVRHPQHVELVQTWRPRLADLAVRDVIE